MNLRERAIILANAMPNDKTINDKVDCALRAFREVAREAAWRGVRAGVSLGAHGEGERDEEARDSVLADMEVEPPQERGDV